MPRGIAVLTSGRWMRLSTSGHCSSGTRYSPGNCPWNSSEESTPGALASAAESRAALLVSPPNSCATADGVAAPRAFTPALRRAASICGSASLNLHDRLRGAELIDARTHDALGTLDCVGAVGNRTFGLIHFEREVDPSLEVETQVYRQAPDARVPHPAGRRIDD